MSRTAEERIELSDGLTIKRGDMISIACNNMWDPTVYPDADKFDGYRFYRMRQGDGQETAAQFVSSSPDHLGFGHGIHVCPGRFFAATELKIALSHILLKYDLRLSERSHPNIIRYGTSLLADRMAKISIRRRSEEIKL
jgi:cytochrome P450